jgi:hypothetical protein
MPMDAVRTREVQIGSLLGEALSEAASTLSRKRRGLPDRPGPLPTPDSVLRGSWGG